MKALVFKGKKNFSIEDLAVPEVKPGEILVKVKYAGICGTDVRIYNGTKSVTPPRITGHEFAGNIVELGQGVNGFSVGDRVTVYPLITCQKCYACLSGKPNICVNRVTIGYEIDGGFADYVVIPKEAVSQGNVIKLPDNVSYEEGAVSEPATAAYHGIEQSELKEGDTIVIVGCGPIGLYHVQLSRTLNPEKIIVVEPDEYKRKLALEMGANYAIDPTSKDVYAEIYKLTSNEGADVVILDVGIPDLVKDSITYVKKGGTFLLFAGCPNGSTMTIDPNIIHYKEIRFTGSSASTPDNQRKVLELVSQGKLNLKRTITDVFELKDWEEAFGKKASYNTLKSVFKIE